MIRSMTGFGRGEVVRDSHRITVEIKSVNHRYLDLNLKMPKKLNPFEGAIRALLKQSLERGKVDLFVSLETYADSSVSVQYNRDLAAEYLQHLDQMADDFSLENDVTVSVLCRLPEILTMTEREMDEEDILRSLEEAVSQSVARLLEARTTEGEHLKEDMLLKLDGMLSDVDAIEKRSPEMLAEYRRNLELRVSELLKDAKVDESRLLTEVAIMADKTCVDEELVRLRSHIRSMRDILVRGGCVGRKLDFIAQEMNREANTILSKANDLEISSHAINLKTEIEKIREQVQNIE